MIALVTNLLFWQSAALVILIVGVIAVGALWLLILIQWLRGGR